ncbi:D-xylose ABC transporter, periplasmic substrate-binding protein [Thermoanaerobacter mathranii subsp. mathranii str. A3]|jgi:D-xylose transport system substrate-binding protein|uniref:D-xylose transport system substrate-binding protein n=3 Tax=Thermoanaerobacter TaxID=1754 RepID=A0ABT9M497_9THEO|nr:MULTISPECIES: substrate-binding domain-containing protein [Thermoanaerobacter]ADH60107.1 D-xylose ABC transporter, periplasmic substrate-binding protein [Thermoanaerobacter mathranii subsp. mathranii str. A3]MDP9750956.1 D-xylose transport system substrate-binding protein [Thermoanaerobacter pentosaceus]SFE13539.1 xylose-binding protein [Thermoanaerobacter thermohydrosulfuricus]
MVKSKKLLAFFLVMILTLSVVLAGCTSSKTNETTNTTSSNGSSSTETKKIKIGFSLPTMREERYQRDRDAFVEEAEKLGAEVLVQGANNDENLQNSQVENLITQGIDVLVLDPQNAASAATLVEKAHQAGIKVISYDRLILNSEPDVYISFDNERVGELQGEFLTKLVPKGTYFIFAGAPTDNNATLFKKGAMKYIQPLVDKGDIKIAFDQAIKDWDPNEALKLAENALTANKNKVDAILAPNDGTAGGIIQALAEQKLAGKVPITGQDAELAAVKRIVEGTQSMTVFKDVRVLARKAAQIAVMLAQGKEVKDIPEINKTVNNQKIDVPSLLLTPVVITKDNIDKELIDSGWFTREQVYGK